MQYQSLKTWLHFVFVICLSAKTSKNTIHNPIRCPNYSFVSYYWTSHFLFITLLSHWPRGESKLKIYKIKHVLLDRTYFTESECEKNLLKSLLFTRTLLKLSLKIRRIMELKSHNLFINFHFRIEQTCQN